MEFTIQPETSMNIFEEFRKIIKAIEDLIWMKRKRNSDQDQVDIKMLEKGKSETNR